MDFITIRRSIIMSLFILILLCVSTISVQAYNIEIVNKNYELTDTTSQGSQTAYFYTILITLKNEGTDFSDDISIEVIDDMDIPTIQNYTFSPSEIKTFQFKDYPLVDAGPHELTIKYYPTNESRTNQGNSGSTTMIIDESQEQTSTPYLSVSFLICFILLIAFIRKRKMKK